MSLPSSITSSFHKDTVTAESGVDLKVIPDAKLDKFHHNTNISSFSQFLFSAKANEGKTGKAVQRQI